MKLGGVGVLGAAIILAVLAAIGFYRYEHRPLFYANFGLDEASPIGRWHPMICSSDNSLVAMDPKHNMVALIEFGKPLNHYKTINEQVLPTSNNGHEAVWTNIPGRTRIAVPSKDNAMFVFPASAVPYERSLKPGEAQVIYKTINHDYARDHEIEEFAASASRGAAISR